MSRTFKKLQLPQDFAQKILDNEIQYKLSEEPSKQVICNLVELYSQGVEYYQSIKSHKYLYFQKKMNQLFASPSKLFSNEQKKQPINLPENQSPLRKKMKSHIEEQRIQALKFKEQQSKMQNQVIEQTNQSNTEKQAKKILNLIEVKQSSVDNLIRSEIQNQNKSIQNKIMQRKKKMASKSFSSYDVLQSKETRQSLFVDDVVFKLENTPNKNKLTPLIVNFTHLIKEDDSDEQKEMQEKKQLNKNRRKLSSLRSLHQDN